jgi:hypothetical protein
LLTKPEWYSLSYNPLRILKLHPVSIPNWLEVKSSSGYFFTLLPSGFARDDTGISFQISIPFPACISVQSNFD